MGRKADTMLRLWAPCGAGQQGTALYMSAACSLSARTAARRGCAGAAMHASRAGGGVAPPGAYSQQASQRAWHRPCPRPRQSASRRAQRVAVATLGVRGARSGVHARGEAGGDRVGRREHRHQPARVRRCGQQAAPHPPDHRAAVVGGQGARGRMRSAFFGQIRRVLVAVLTPGVALQVKLIAFVVVPDLEYSSALSWECSNWGLMRAWCVPCRPSSSSDARTAPTRCASSPRTSPVRARAVMCSPLLYLLCEDGHCSRLSQPACLVIPYSECLLCSG